MRTKKTRPPRWTGDRHRPRNRLEGERRVAPPGPGLKNIVGPPFVKAPRGRSPRAPGPSRLAGETGRASRHQGGCRATQRAGNRPLDRRQAETPRSSRDQGVVTPRPPEEGAWAAASRLSDEEGRPEGSLLRPRQRVPQRSGGKTRRGGRQDSGSAGRWAHCEPEACQDRPRRIRAAMCAKIARALFTGRFPRGRKGGPCERRARCHAEA